MHHFFWPLWKLLWFIFDYFKGYTEELVYILIGTLKHIPSDCSTQLGGGADTDLFLSFQLSSDKSRYVHYSTHGFGPKFFGVLFSTSLHPTALPDLRPTILQGTLKASLSSLNNTVLLHLELFSQLYSGHFMVKSKPLFEFVGLIL